MLPWGQHVHRQGHMQANGHKAGKKLHRAKTECVKQKLTETENKKKTDKEIDINMKENRNKTMI